MARKKWGNQNRKPDSDLLTVQSTQPPDLLSFDDATEQQPRVSAMEEFMDDFKSGFGAGIAEDSEEEAEAQRANDEFDRVTTLGMKFSVPQELPDSDPAPAAPDAGFAGGMGSGGASSSVDPNTSSVDPSKKSQHAFADEYQSPYAMQTGEQDLLTVGVTATIAEDEPSSMLHDGLSPSAFSETVGEGSSRDEVSALLNKALELYADDKIVIAGDMLLKKINQTLLHERYCRENPTLAEMMNRYYVIWTARKTMDAINMRRHAEMIEADKDREFNRVRKELVDKQWREESWFSPHAYSWFKEKGLEEAPAHRNTTVDAFEDGTAARSSKVLANSQESPDSDDGDLSVANASPSDPTAWKTAKTLEYPTPSTGGVSSSAASSAGSGRDVVNNSVGAGPTPAGGARIDASSSSSSHPRELTMQEGTKYDHEVDTEKFSTWDLQKEYQGVRVAISPDIRYKDATDESSRIYSSVVEGKVDIEFFPLLSMLNEVDLYPAWMEGMLGGKVVKCEVLERVSRSNFVVRMLFQMTWPLAWRKLVFRVLAHDCLNDEDQVKQMVVVLEDVSLKEERQILARNPYWDIQHDKPYEGSIRARVQNSALLITPSGSPGETWVQTYCSIIPRMRSAPQWVVDSGYKNGAYHFIQMLRDARKVTKQAIYRDRQMDPNNLFYAWVKRRVRDALPFERCPNSVSMGGLTSDDVLPVRNLVQKAVTLNEEMTTTVDVNGKQVVIDKRVYLGGKTQQKDFGSSSAHALAASRQDLYEEDSSAHGDEGCTSSSEEEGMGLISGGSKSAGAGWKKTGTLLEAQNSPVSPVSLSGTTLLEEAPDSRAGVVPKQTLPPRQTDSETEVVRLVSDPTRTLDMAWALDYVKMERRVTVLNVREGMKVRRGLHWKYGDEDLGVTPNGGYGVVVKFDLQDQICKVRWHVPGGWVYSEQKKVGKYRLGPVFFDLALYEDEVQAAVTEMLHNQMDPVRDTQGNSAVQIRS